jgi:2-keto-4-pentenoate hydratase/2-oxohepta-3-ene-1,7-dioic acid hydratase in catechol pathway
MKLLTFTRGPETCLGSPLPNGDVVDLTALLRQAWGPQAAVPRDVLQLIEAGEPALAAVQSLLEGGRTHAAHTVPAAEAKLLAPIPRPGKNVFCVGRNYREHIIEGNRAAGRDPNDFPKALELFSKPWTTVVGTGAPVKRHAKHTRLLDYEVELAIVIGKDGVDIPRDRALDHVFGYTIVNDVTARDLQKRHGQWFKGKSLDTFCPMGPWVVHRSAVPDAQDLRLVMEVNGEVRQDASTSDQLIDVPSIIEQVSAGLTLHAGDVIATGTPSGVGFAMQPPRCLEPGDVMRAQITGLGELVNTVVE